MTLLQSKALFRVKETKTFRVFVSLIFSLVLGMSTASAAPRCDQVFTQTFSEKLWATGKAPVAATWQRMSYMEVPVFMSHPLYRDIEAKMPAPAANALKNILYYSSNGLRKAYNTFSVRGLGLPLPAIKTQAERAGKDDLTWQKDETTYWGSFNAFFERFAFTKHLTTASKKMYTGLAFTATTLFAIHTAGNVAQVVQTRPVLLDASTAVVQVLPLKNSQVQILNETAPFPHTAIRIGNMVFSHGVESLTQTPVDFYLKRNLLNEQGGIPSFKENTSVQNKFAGLQRGVDSVILNLDPATVLQMRDFLMEQNAKTYNNKTFVNSCATMIVRALKEQGVSVSVPLLDASPSILLAQLSLQSAAGFQNKNGEPLVQGIYNIQYKGTAPQSDQSLRNFLIREMDAAVHLQVYTLPLRAAERVAINKQTPEIRDLYTDSTGRQQILQDLQKQAEADLHMIQEYDLYTLKRDTLKSQEAPASELAALNAEYKEVFARQISQLEDLLKDPGISFVDYHLNLFKIDFLKQALL